MTNNMDAMVAGAQRAPRQYEWYDVLEDPKGGQVAHLSHRHTLDVWGHWSSLCGRIVPSWHVSSVADTDHGRVCVACDRHARRFSR